MATATSIITDDINDRLEELNNRATDAKESSIFDIAKGIRNKIYEELSGKGKRVTYNSLKLFEEFRPEDIRAVNEFPEDLEKFISVVGVGERINYQPGGITEKFADIEIRVFLSDVGGYKEVIDPFGGPDPSDARNLDPNNIDLIPERDPGTMIKLLGIISDILDVLEQNAQKVEIPYLTYTYTRIDEVPVAANSDGVIDSPEAGVFVPIIYQKKGEAEEDVLVEIFPNAPLSLDQKEEIERKPPEIKPHNRKTVLQYKEGQFIRIQEPNSSRYTWAHDSPTPDGYDVVAGIKADNLRKRPRNTQDILVRQVTTDEGLLAEGGLAAGEISVEVRYQ